MRALCWSLAPALLFLVALDARTDDKSGVDDEGFVRQWLVLAPIPLGEGVSGADGLAREQVKDEAKLAPKAEAKVKVGDKELVWKKVALEGHLLDFNALLGGTTEDSVAYAVTFVTAAEEMKDVKMKTGSDDQCKVYLNGKEVFKYAEIRAADKDQDTTAVTLRKGVNVLVVKVVNEKADWSFCVRFTDKDDKPLAKLTARSAE